jgi:hypothetical protein
MGFMAPVYQDCTFDHRAVGFYAGGHRAIYLDDIDVAADDR